MTSVDVSAGERPTFTKHLECSLTGDSYPADKVHTLSRAGKPLLVRYDLEALGRAVTRESLASRAYDLWRYREFLPVRRKENVVSLGETVTPLLRAPRLLKWHWVSLLFGAPLVAVNTLWVVKIVCRDWGYC